MGAGAVAGAVVGSVKKDFGVALVEAEASPEVDAGAGEEAGAVVDVEAGTEADDLWRVSSGDRAGRLELRCSEGRFGAGRFGKVQDGRVGR